MDKDPYNGTGSRYEKRTRNQRNHVGLESERKEKIGYKNQMKHAMWKDK